MVAYPIEQSALESNIVTGFLRFNPFVPEYLLAFREKFLVEPGTLDKTAGFFAR